MARLLLRSGRPVVLAVNKVDNEAREATSGSSRGSVLPSHGPFRRLHGRGAGRAARRPGGGRSARHGRDRDVASSTAWARLDAGEPVDEAERPGGDIGRRSSGRPNVGKSTLFNRLIGDDRAIVHDLPGTTRDAIDTLVETPDGPVRFIDTAGMRRRTKEAEGAEYYSMVRALRAIDRPTMALLVIDAGEGVTRQDQRLAERVDAAGNPVVVVLNKWDLLDNEAKAKVRADRWLTCSGSCRTPPPWKSAPGPAGECTGCTRPWPRRSRPTAGGCRLGSLNRAIAAAQAAQPAPHGARVLYATQGATDPPTFTLFTSKELPASYMRYLERSIREHFGFGPTPLKLRTRRRAS